MSQLEHVGGVQHGCRDDSIDCDSGVRCRFCGGPRDSRRASNIQYSATFSCALDGRFRCLRRALFGVVPLSVDNLMTIRSGSLNAPTRRQAAALVPVVMTGRPAGRGQVPGPSENPHGGSGRFTNDRFRANGLIQSDLKGAAKPSGSPLVRFWTRIWARCHRSGKHKQYQ
jgi:hypothetical protein